MKRLFLLAILLVSMTASAQRVVTKFLGIPIDGSKKEMIRKLKNKGFHSVPSHDFMRGEFNGEEVLLDIKTYKNKVCRINVVDDNDLSESAVKIRFNNLCRQFLSSKRYTKASDEDFIIPEDEDISHEIRVNAKDYFAVFYQEVAPADTVAFNKEIEKYAFENEPADLLDESTDLGQQFKRVYIDLYKLKARLNRSVMFIIFGDNGRYRIGISYVNKWNEAQGEDL